jgi:hypothetical protein
VVLQRGRGTSGRLAKSAAMTHVCVAVMLLALLSADKRAWSMIPGCEIMVSVEYRNNSYHRLHAEQDFAAMRATIEYEYRNEAGEIKYASAWCQWNKDPLVLDKINVDGVIGQVVY